MATSPEEPSNGTIEFGGVRTIRTAEQSHSLLAEALHSASLLSVDCSKVTEADVSLVQLLLSARKSLAGSGKSLTLAYPADGPLHDVLARGGFLNEEIPADERAFWLNSEGGDENRA